MLESRKIEVATWEKAAELVMLEFGPFHGHTAVKIAGRLYAQAEGLGVAELRHQARAREVLKEHQATNPPAKMDGTCRRHGPYTLICRKCVEEQDARPAPAPPGGSR